MPGVFAGSLHNIFNAMPQHRRSIIKDGISFPDYFQADKQLHPANTRGNSARSYISRRYISPLFF